jgi:hypothetical protein
MNLTEQRQARRQMSFAEFWDYYLEAHRMPATRVAHYIATAVGFASAAAAIYEGQPLLMLGGLLLAIALAVGSHWLFEHNQPMLRVNAFYGVAAGLRMCWLAMTGGLRKEYRRLDLMD